MAKAVVPPDPEAADENRRSGKSDWQLLKSLWPYVRPYRYWLLTALLATTVTGILGLGFPWILGTLVDSALDPATGDLGRSAVNKLQLQGIQRVACRGEEDNSARRLVQAMHRLQPCFPRPCFVDEVAQIERLVKIDVRPVHQQPVGFHHGAHVFILVQHVECRFCT